MTYGPIPPGEVGWTRGRIVFLGLSGLALVAILWWTAEVLLPFLLAAITAYVLSPAVAAVERLRLPRGAAIIAVYALAGLAAWGVGAATAPRLVAEMSAFVDDVPEMARKHAAQWSPRIEQRVRQLTSRIEGDLPRRTEAAPALRLVPEGDGAYSVVLGSGIEVVQEGPRTYRVRPVRPEPDFSVAGLVSQGIAEAAEYAQRNALELLRLGRVVVGAIARGVFLTFMTLMMAAYLIHTREAVVDFLRSLVPAQARLAFDRLLFRMDRGFAGVVRGQLVIMLLNGLLSALGFWLCDLKYWPVLALVAGLLSIIPIFGAILSSVPAVLVGITQSPWTAFLVLLWILLIHQVEANLLNPKIIGVAAKLHPVLVVFALLVGEHFHGLWGALFAVPALSLAQSVFNHFRFESLPDAPPDSVFLRSARDRVGS